MAQQLVTDFVVTNVPGAYSQYTVQNTSVGIAATGIVTIVGEADGGPSYTTEDLSANFFGPDQLSKVIAKYTSGQIVDAFYALTAPSNDTNITGAPNRIYIAKTNTGFSASIELPNVYGTLYQTVEGILGNNTQEKVTATQLEVAPQITSNTITVFNDFTFTVTSANATAGAVYSNNTHHFTVTSTIVAGTSLATTGNGLPLASGTLTKVSGTGDATITFSAVTVPLDAASFTIRLNGTDEAIVTLSTNFADHSTAADLATELTTLLGPLTFGLISASAGIAPNTIVLTFLADPTNYQNGFGKSVELIDSTPSDLSLMGLTPGLYVSSAESAVQINVSNSNMGLNSTVGVSGQIPFTIGYQGTSASLILSGTMLNTTVVGGIGSNIINLDMSQFATLRDLANYINTLPGYTAFVASFGNQLPPSALDQEPGGIGICSTGSGLMPGRIKDGLYLFKNAIVAIPAVSFLADATAGIPTPQSQYYFLTGGQRGATRAIDVVNAVNTLEGIATNFVVPLFSEDASADIILGLTDPASTYTIDAVNALIKSHCIAMSTPIMKRNREGVLSYFGSFANAQIQAQSIAFFRCSLTFQQVKQVNSTGAIQLYQPWYGACIAAGMQAAGFYKGITNKFANVISYVDPSDFDSGSPTDVEAALLAGLLILQSTTGGNRWISDQTTYGYDTNFVYNSIQAVYGADIISLDLAESFQATFVGQSLADVNAASGLTFLARKMEQYFQIKLITSSSDAPAGYKNAVVSVNGPTMTVSVEIKLSTTLYFVAISFVISEVTQSAS